ncbi:MAG: ATP-binding protein [Bacteroidia bacterium]|nr:ATP-binding protein [Bacteroidia bacterium]
MNARGVVLFVFLFCTSGVVFSQLPFRTGRISVDNGLSQNSVWDVLHDDYGYMWVGTAGGIDCWDGANFTHYQHNPADSTSLSGTTGFRFHKDSLGGLWIVHNKGVSRFDYLQGRIQNIIRVNFTCVLMGEWKGLLFMLTGNNELTKVNLQTNRKFRSALFSPGYTYSNASASPCAAQTGPWMFIMNHDSSMVCYNADNAGMKIHHFTERISFPFVINDKTVAMMRSDSVVLWRRGNNTLQKEQHYVPEMRGHYNIMGRMHKGTLWTCGQEGIFLLDTLSWHVISHYTTIDPEVSQREFIYNLRHDRSGNLLVCSNLSGFYILSDSKNRFPLHVPKTAKTTIVKGVSSYESFVFTGQFEGGITIFHEDTTWSIPNLSGEPNPESIWGLHVIDSAQLIAVTDRDWVIYNWRENKTVRRTSCSPYYQLNFPCFIPDETGLWVNLSRQNNSGIYHIRADGAQDTLLYWQNEIITCFQFLPDGSLLIGTMEELIHWKEGVKRNIISDVWVKSLCLASGGDLYCATTSGCYLLNPELKITQVLTIDQGMPDNFVYSVLEDDSGKIWMSTNKGIACYMPKLQVFRNYTVDDGLQSNEFNTGAYFKAADGKLYFGGIQGVNEIDPRVMFVNAAGPTTILHRIMVGDQDWKTDTSHNMIRTVTLPYWNSTLSFDFSGGEFSMPERNMYRFKLEPYDEGWINSGVRHFARYANLAPGNYVLTLQSANADGVWGTEKKISIIIIPPFWQQIWFYVMETVIGLILLFSLFYWSRKRQQKKIRREIDIVQRLEKERIRISRDLHDHVGAQLSYVIAGLDHMTHHPEEWKDEKMFRNRLEKLTVFGRDAMLTLRETIWAISSAKLTAEDFADRFKQYVLRVMDMDPDISVEFDEKLVIDAVLTPERSLCIFRICQEAFHNSLKHSGATGISITFESDQGHFCVTIEDNGKGFENDGATKEGHYGLVNMKTRAEEIGGKVLISSESGKGTRVSLEVMLT